MITDHAVAAAAPALAFLSALTHGNDEDAGLAVLSAALDALAHDDTATAQLYIHLVTRALSEPRRRFLEERAMLNINPDDIPIPDNMLPVLQWIARRREAVLRAEALADQRTAQKLAGKILRVLEQRTISLTPEQRDALLKCTDLDQADIWFDRSLVAQTAEDVFQPPAAAK